MLKSYFASIISERGKVPDPDPRGPKTCGSCGYGSGSPTLRERYWDGRERGREDWNQIRRHQNSMSHFKFIPSMLVKTSKFHNDVSCVS
jgi:hypothetical protein